MSRIKLQRLSMAQKRAFPGTLKRGYSCGSNTYATSTSDARVYVWSPLNFWTLTSKDLGDRIRIRDHNLDLGASL